MAKQLAIQIAFLQERLACDVKKLGTVQRENQGKRKKHCLKVP